MCNHQLLNFKLALIDFSMCSLYNWDTKRKEDIKMSLGERIYKLRREKSLSQGDLADMLGVSRQSISKWENNSAVPEIEKIIKMSDIFAVSLDELLKGEVPTNRAENVMVASVDNSQKTENSQRKITGTILLCMAFVVVMFFLAIGGGLGGLVFASPFLICGILCFVLKKNVGLWCAWVVYALLDMYLLRTTSVSRIGFLLFLLRPQDGISMGVIVSGILVIYLILMIVVTVLCFRKKPFASMQQGKKQMIEAWIVFAVLQCVAMIWGNSQLYKHIIENSYEMYGILSLVSFVLSWSKIITLTVALVLTARFIFNKNFIQK